MKTIKMIMASLLIATSSVGFANEGNSKFIDIDAYEKNIKEALSLYQSNNYESALPALEKVAQLGEKKAQYIVGTMYLNGQGTPQDLKKSYAWLSVANEQKTKSWKKPLNMLEEKLPKDYLAVVNEEAKTYIDRYGVKAQKLKCRPMKTLGSKKPKHTCKKSELKPGFYYAG
ncbi:sel1 repeat family protein [Thalassotalea sp. M1531]|uniref:Sel1 repeat family protein n=1 Tax=Thalassotalea algicola TaxID=2716224 RepID=A0A7Y0L9I6_9GAMM|nr:sel1 repeat family protein [Thalassotalea algicola]NMP30459.1 sel1 repeat family protein [Thalassotalea algicola]